MNAMTDICAARAMPALTDACGLSKLASNVPGALYRYKGTFERGAVEFISPAIEEIVGYAPAEVCAQSVDGMLLPWLSAHPDHGSDYVEYLKGRYALGKPMRAINKAAAKDGSTRWIMLSARPVEEFSTGEFALDGLVLDVTDQYEERQRLSDAIAREFKLQTDLAKAQESKDSIGFTRAIVHDLNNVIAAARSFAELVADASKAKRPIYDYALKIVSACEHAAEIVDRLVGRARRLSGGNAAAPAMLEKWTLRDADVRGTEKILIVDDEADLADNLSTLLSRLGYETAPVYSADEALAVFRENPLAWDVIVTDQNMPEMTGRQLLSRIKSTRPDVRTILCSALSGLLSVGKDGSEVVDAYLTKPVAAAGVAACIRRLAGPRIVAASLNSVCK